MPQYSNPKKVIWYDHILCPVCGERTNSWEKRVSRALGYRQIVCETCIASEYSVRVEDLRTTMREHFGLIPCPGI